jgi:hypothetical protein
MQIAIISEYMLGRSSLGGERWVGEIRNTVFYSKTVKEIGYLEYLGVDGRKILKCILYRL